MFRFFSAAILMAMLCWITQSFAHDAFYPHHREDFESMTRRNELRGTVLLSTAVFVGVLGTIVYIAMRNSKDTDDREETETVQERLTSTANAAAEAAKRVLKTGGSIATAAETALTTYSEASGVRWQLQGHGQRPTENVPYQIRFKIGSDIVTLSITTEIVELKVEQVSSQSGMSPDQTRHKAKVVLQIADAEET